jgi:SAM-dependent methyltransferase
VKQKPCAAYNIPRLAAIYDPINPPTPDYDFYVALAGSAPLTALDMGCGTGRLACALATRGHRVTGADPSPAMLGIARNRPGAKGVTWVEADAATFRSDTRFDLIIMTGHVFQVFLDDREVRTVLANLRRHLAPCGRLAFETRNPEIREWEGWMPAETQERVSVPAAGKVNVHYDIQKVEGELVTFETHFSFSNGDTDMAPHTLRFMGRDRLAGFLAEAGFGNVTWFGDFDRQPIGPESPEIIAIAAKD